MAWLFTYGQLMWECEFPYRQKFSAILPNYIRRFCAVDPGGRWATVLPLQNDRVWGILYELPLEESNNILRKLDVYEDVTYTRKQLDCFKRGENTPIKAWVYMAKKEYVKAESISDQALEITKTLQAKTYFLKTAESVKRILAEVGDKDEYLEELEKLVNP